MKVVNLGDLIDPSKDLGKIALIDLHHPEAPREWSYAAIDDTARAVARLLSRRGFVRGSRVAILGLNRAAYVAAYFGIMRAGLVAVPVNSKLPRPTMNLIIEDAGAVLAFADGARTGDVPSGVPVINFDDQGPEGFARQLDPGPFPTCCPTPGEVAEILYTSGSTGRPKGVLLSHGSQIWGLEQRRDMSGGEAARYIVAAPLFHMNGLFNTKLSFFTHASMVLLPSFTTHGYVEAIGRWRVTALTSVPTMLARITKEAELLARTDLSSVRRVRMGSAPLTQSLVERVQAVFENATVSNGYGATEGGPAVFGPHPEGIPTPPGSVGYPLPDGEVKLVEGSNENEGVLLMRNAGMMSGYHNLPEATKKVMRDGWYYSGDVMRYDENGFFYFLGRADDMFVCSGENIYPGEIEKMLERHQAIHQACVVPLPDEERGHVPVAFIVPRPGMTVAPDEVKRFALANAPAYQHPRRIALLDELPWAGTDKIDRRALIERAAVLERSLGWAR